MNEWATSQLIGWADCLRITYSASCGSLNPTMLCLYKCELMYVELYLSQSYRVARGWSFSASILGLVTHILPRLVSENCVTTELLPYVHRSSRVRRVMGKLGYFTISAEFKLILLCAVAVSDAVRLYWSIFWQQYLSSITSVILWLGSRELSLTMSISLKSKK